jgi:hypothetical protein
MMTQGACTTETPVVGYPTYADYLLSQGQTVVEMSGVRWMKYQGALIPTSAMPVFVDPPYQEAEHLLKKTGSLFLRYTTRPDENDTLWWHIVCRHYNIAEVSANTRSKIHRGLKRFDIKRESPRWVADQGYDCHRESYQRYKFAKPQSRAEFRQFMLSLHHQAIFDVWVCRQSQALLGYIICVRDIDGVFMHTIDITPQGLHDYAAYAMLHHLLEFYVNQHKIPVTNGTRSIAHATHMQDFLIKFGFQREFGKLHVIYRRDVGFAVKLLYPFRGAMRRLEALPLLHKVSAVLRQEEIVRSQYGPQV